MAIKLKDRIESYKLLSDHKLMPRLPVIISVNGRSFSKLTQLLDKPYSKEFAECLMSTMHRLCVEIEGVAFAYMHNDQILLVCRNDQSEDTSPWFDGRIQKISSIAASLATVHFKDCAKTIKLNLTLDPIFTAQVFNTPNITETINAIIYEQQQNFHSSIQFSCIYELLNKYDKNTIKEMLAGLTIDEKKDLLNQECNVDFNDYPTIFKRGACCYRTQTEKGDMTKLKWFIDINIPIFTKDHNFLHGILK